MINTEKAFDMLPSVVDIYDKLDIDGFREGLKKENVDKKIDEKEAGIKAIKYILKNSQKIKEELFEIAAIFEEKPVEEIKKQNFFKTVNSIKEVFTNEEMTTFFKQAMQ